MPVSVIASNVTGYNRTLACSVASLTVSGETKFTLPRKFTMGVVINEIEEQPIASDSLQRRCDCHKISENQIPIETQVENNCKVGEVGCQPMQLTVQTVPLVNCTPCVGSETLDSQYVNLANNRMATTNCLLSEQVLDMKKIDVEQGERPITFIRNARNLMPHFAGLAAREEMPETLEEFLTGDFQSEILKKDQEFVIQNYDALKQTFVSHMMKHVHNICDAAAYINPVTFYAFIRDGTIEQSKLKEAGIKSKNELLTRVAEEQLNFEKKKIPSQTSSINITTTTITANDNGDFVDDAELQSFYDSL